jgi:DNA-binding CsgD family transcriptional regulator
MADGKAVLLMDRACTWRSRRARRWSAPARLGPRRAERRARRPRRRVVRGAARGIVRRRRGRRRRLQRRRAGGDAGEPEFLGDGPRVVVLADPGDERIGEWLIDGCSVLPRDASSAQIAAAAEAARTGLVATPPAYAADALRYERVGERRSVPPGFDALTPRERQVLVEMSHGLGNREIGGVLGISAHTAKFHVAQIIAKLDAQSRAHAVAKALRAGLVDA